FIARALELAVGLGVSVVKAAHAPSVLPLGLEGGIRGSDEVGLDLADRQKPGAVLAEDDRRDVVVEQHPLPVPVGPAGEEHLMARMTRHDGLAGAAVAEEQLHLSRPLGMRGIADAEARTEESPPV